MSKNPKDLTQFIVNYWLRKENRERLTLNNLQQKEREQLVRIQRRRRNDLKYWFDIDIPERDIVSRNKRIKRYPQYNIAPKAKKQKLNVLPTITEEQECENRRNEGFWQSLLSCFRG